MRDDDTYRCVRDFRPLKVYLDRDLMSLFSINLQGRRKTTVKQTDQEYPSTGIQLTIKKIRKES